MSDPLLIGALGGVGLLLILAGVRQRARPLAEILGPYEGEGLADTSGTLRADRPVVLTIGQKAAWLASRVGMPLCRPCDLAILDRDLESQLAATGLSTLGLAVSAAAIVEVIGYLGSTLPLPVLAIAMACGAAIGAVGPAVNLRRKAAVERSRFKRALSCWLELVALAQAGGMGIEGALHSSSSVSDDRCFSRLAHCLETGRLTNDVWSSLARLGDEIGVSDLEELAATLGLAGTEGARVRATLVAKAASLRARQTAEAQGAANVVTERLFLPSVVMMLAFMIFLMYPAGVALSHVF